MENNIVKPDPKSQEIDLKDCLLNGQVKNYVDYLPNNNVCDSQNVANSPQKKEYCESECFNEERTLIVKLEPSETDFLKDADVSSVSQSEDTNSLNENSSANESSQEPQTSEPIEEPLESEEEDSDRLSQSSDNYYYDRQNNGSFGTSTKKKRISSGTVRGRPRKTVVPMYHSQISGDKNAIKIRIKKSHFSTHVQLTPNKKKSGRRKKHKTYSDTDNSDYERKPKRSRGSSASAAAVTDNNVSST